MLNIAGNKLFQYPERIAGDFRPITADVFLTNFCNNNCSWCTYHRWELDHDAYYMRFEDFRLYLDRLISLGVQGVILTGGGEPTINPDFDLIVRYLEDRQVHYGINTNFNKLRLFRPDYLKISLDGYDEESYFRVRGVLAYSAVISNIIEYLNWKKKNSPQTSVGIQIVVTDPADVRKFYSANSALDVDYIAFRPVESTCGQFYSPENAAAVARAVEAIKGLAKNDSRVLLNYKWDYLSRQFKKCSAHWAQIALDERGNVIYCCHKPFEIVGHILDPDIMERYAKAQTNMFLCDVPCRLTAPNLAFEDMTKPVANKQFI